MVDRDRRGDRRDVDATAFESIGRMVGIILMVVMLSYGQSRRMDAAKVNVEIDRGATRRPIATGSFTNAAKWHLSGTARSAASRCKLLYACTRHSAQTCVKP